MMMGIVQHQDLDNGTITTFSDRSSLVIHFPTEKDPVWRLVLSQPQTEAEEYALRLVPQFHTEVELTYKAPHSNGN